MKKLTSEPLITRKDYDFWVDGVKNEYIEYEHDEQELAVCECGNKTFWVYQPKSMYETNGICTNCRKSYCLHDG